MSPATRLQILTAVHDLCSLLIPSERPVNRSVPAAAEPGAVELVAAAAAELVAVVRVAEPAAAAAAELVAAVRVAEPAAAAAAELAVARVAEPAAKALEEPEVRAAAGLAAEVATQTRGIFITTG
jgi:hypothetical protein